MSRAWFWALVSLSPLEAVDHAVRKCAIAGKTDRTGGIEWRHHADEVALFELLVDERGDGLAHQVGTRSADVQLVEKEREHAGARLTGGARRLRIRLDRWRIGTSTAVEFDGDDRPWGAILEHVEICGFQAEHGVARAISDHHIAAHDRRRDAAWRGLVVPRRRHQAGGCYRQYQTGGRSCPARVPQI